MKLEDLKDNQAVRYRIGMAGRQAPEFGPWTTGALRVYRREVDLLKRLRSRSRDWRAGDILTLSIKGVACAEFSQSDWSPEYKQFNCEDWYLEIEGLE